MRTWGRREFLHGLTAAGTASLLGVHPAPVAAEPPPETTRLRLTFQSRTICTGLKYFRELLETEGFTDLQYANEESTSRRAARLASGASDIDVTYAAYLILRVDAGDPIVVLTGAHCGLPRAVCDQWDTHDPRPEGKGGRHRRVWGTRHVYIASMAAYVGLDPRKDIAVAGNREFVRSHPAATKRALRAMLKAADLCGADPGRAVKLLSDNGVTAHYEYVVQTMKEVPYGKWREYHPEDTIRFYSLRLREAGLIKSSPQKVIAQGTDWRFLNELKKELKG